MIPRNAYLSLSTTELPGVHYRLIFNTTDTSELQTAELSPKVVRNSEVLLYINLS